jgi:general secretion pathway protein D
MELDATLRKAFRLARFAGLAVLVVANACATRDLPNTAGYKGAPIDRKKAAETESETALNKKPESRNRVNEGPVVPGATPPAPTPSEQGPAPSPKQIKPTRIGFDGAPLVAFINAVFAETLGFAVRIDPSVSQKTETITLRTGDAVSGKDLFDVSAAALRDYGVEVVVETPRTLRFTTIERQRDGQPEMFRGGSIGAGVRNGNSPVYYLYTVRATNMNSLVQMLSAAFGNRLTLTGSPTENALLLSGQPQIIESALNILSSFDQPRMSGKKAATVTPVFFTPTRMAEGLARVLRASGYNVSTTPDAAAINLVPLDEVGVIIVYAVDENAQTFALDWARKLDQPGAAGEAQQAFVYFVQNTDADSVAAVLSSAMGGAASGGRQQNGANSTASLSGSAVQAPAAAPAAGGTAAIGGFQAGGLRVAVDPGRNALILLGNAEQYGALLPLLRQLDRAAGEVLIEVVLAEITTTGNSNLGLEYGLDRTAKLGDFNVTGGTLGGLGVGSSGLTFNLLNPRTNARIVLNALSKKDRVNVLSNPRVVSKSGSNARIQVGTQVPVLRQQSTNVAGGQSGVTNSVDYIDTGVVLSVRPVIRADRRVDLELSQEVSEAQTNTTSSISSPLIFTRSVSTQLSLLDGQTVLLGGLKSQNKSSGRSGVPGVVDIPVVGGLFSNQSSTVRDTELLIFITPYIVTDPQAADAIAGRYRDSMRTWPKVSGGLSW